jgi:hypothetical protein
MIEKQVGNGRIQTVACAPDITYTLAPGENIFHTKTEKNGKNHTRVFFWQKNLRKKAKVIWKLTRFGLSYKQKNFSGVSS